MVKPSFGDALLFLGLRRSSMKPEEVKTRLPATRLVLLTLLLAQAVGVHHRGGGGGGPLLALNVGVTALGISSIQIVETLDDAEFLPAFIWTLPFRLQSASLLLWMVWTTQALVSNPLMRAAFVMMFCSFHWIIMVPLSKIRKVPKDSNLTMRGEFAAMLFGSAAADRKLPSAEFLNTATTVEWLRALNRIDPSAYHFPERFMGVLLSLLVGPEDAVGKTADIVEAKDVAADTEDSDSDSCRYPQPRRDDRRSSTATVKTARVESEDDDEVHSIRDISVPRNRLQRRQSSISTIHMGEHSVGEDPSRHHPQPHRHGRRESPTSPRRTRGRVTEDDASVSLPSLSPPGRNVVE